MQWDCSFKRYMQFRDNNKLPTRRAFKFTLSSIRFKTSFPLIPSPGVSTVQLFFSQVNRYLIVLLFISFITSISCISHLCFCTVNSWTCLLSIFLLVCSPFNFSEWVLYKSRKLGCPSVKTFNGKNKSSSFLLADGIIKPSLKKKKKWISAWCHLKMRYGRWQKPNYHFL